MSDTNTYPSSETTMRLVPKGGGAWQTRGPAALNGNLNESQDTKAAGAVNALAAHPTDPDILFAGSVNGGIWRTDDATTLPDQAMGLLGPSWVQQTDTQTAQSIGDIQFDPTDATNNTLVAGIGRFSSFGRAGSDRTGLLKTTDGGTTWLPTGADLAGLNIAAVAPRGSVIMAAADNADSGACGDMGIYRSDDDGVTFTQSLEGSADALATDPADPAILYASVINIDASCNAASLSGIYKSIDTGQSWNKVSDANIDSFLTGITNTAAHVEISVGPSNTVFVATVGQDPNALSAVFRSPDGGTNWVQLDLPETVEPDMTTQGIHPGTQGSIHTSFVADPTDSNVVYIGGDRQPLNFNTTPISSIGATGFNGRLFRGDASQASGSQWTPLTHVGTADNSAPHADSRVMVFSANGTLLQGDDGGVYSQTSASDTTGVWRSANGNLQITEIHQSEYDPVFDTMLGGNQDNGTALELLGTVPQEWAVILGGDGADVMVDSVSLASQQMTVNYISAQFLGNFLRFTLDPMNPGGPFQNVVFLALTPTDGSPAVAPQFYTPLALNSANPLRFVLGGANGVYETFDQGDTVESIGAGISVLNFGRQVLLTGADDNEELVLLGGCTGSCFDQGDGDDGVFARTTAGADVTLVQAVQPNDVIRGVAINPVDSSNYFYIDNDNVFRFSTARGALDDLTGDLGAAGLGGLRSIEYIHTEGFTDAIIVGGTTGGLYISYADSGFTSWTQLGTNFPNALVTEIEYDRVGEQVLATTLGRGAFVLPVSQEIPQNGIFSDGFED